MNYIVSFIMINSSLNKVMRPLTMYMCTKNCKIVVFLYALVKGRYQDKNFDRFYRAADF